MRWLIFALGVALALGGAASIVSGLPYIRMESGWTEVIAGTTALSAGIMTVALAAVLNALRRLEPRFVRDDLSASQDGARTTRAAGLIQSPVADSVGDEPDVAPPEPDVPVPSVAESDLPPPPAPRSLEERIWSGPSTLGQSANARAEPAEPPSSYRTTDRSSGVRPAAPILSRERDARRRPESDAIGVAAPRSYARTGAASPVRTDAGDRVPSLIPSPRPSDAADTGPVSTLAESPTVVGRYESGGASYVLFSDGTIEVETEMGTHRFGSMEELKAYIDQQDKAALG